VARPRNADAEATRRRILDSACAVLASDGPQAMSLRAVARRAQVSPAVVHHYFGDRSGLADACMDSAYAGLHELALRLRVELDGGERLETVIERSLRTGFRYAREHRPVVQLLLATVIDSGQLDAARRDETQRPFLNAAAAHLATRVALDEVELRLRLKTVVMAAARYAVMNDEELRGIVGGQERDLAARVEHHLVAVALRLLCG
jgi:AcrR family transcriptional regulator